MSDGFKYELGDTLFFMKENRVISGIVCARVRVDTDGDLGRYRYEHKIYREAFGEARIVYSTTEGCVDEKNAFKAKSLLLESL